MLRGAGKYRSACGVSVFGPVCVGRVLVLLLKCTTFILGPVYVGRFVDGVVFVAPPLGMTVKEDPVIAVIMGSGANSKACAAKGAAQGTGAATVDIFHADTLTACFHNKDRLGGKYEIHQGGETGGKASADVVAQSVTDVGPAGRADEDLVVLHIRHQQVVIVTSTDRRVGRMMDINHIALVVVLGILHAGEPDLFEI